MMHLLRKYDVAPLRFAMMRCLPQCAVRHTSFAKRTSLAKPTSFAAGKHHSKNAPLSVDKSAFFVGWGGRFRTTKCRSFLVADLTARLFSSRYGYPLAMMGADSIRYLPGYQRHACKLNLCRRELTHLRRGDFSTDSTDYGTQMTGRSSR